MPKSANRNFQDLVRNDRCLADTLGRNAIELKQYISRRLHSFRDLETTTDDIWQETQYFACKCQHSFASNSEAAFQAWLKKIANHRILDAVIRQKRFKRGGKFHRVSMVEESSTDRISKRTNHGDNPFYRVARMEATQRLRQVMDKLPTSQYQTIQFRFFEGMPIKEIAGRLNRTENSIRGLLDRAKRTLRDCMGEPENWQIGTN